MGLLKRVQTASSDAWIGNKGESIEGAFAGRECPDRQGVDVRRHHLPDGFVHETMASYDGQAGEPFGNHVDREMAAAVGGADVSLMQVTVVDHFELDGSQRQSQPVGDPFAA